MNPVALIHRHPGAGAAALGLICGACACGAAQAQSGRHDLDPTGVRVLPPVVVTATRTETPAFDVPASIDRIGTDTLRDARAQVNISEGLGGVPGLLARDRQNYAQDVQISVRGFGARSTFGIRGVRLYVDGIPATLPDGQGQISHVDLGSAERIEVLRGPFSALYGNSSGGVIQVFTEEGQGRPTLTTSVAGGSDGAVRFGVKASGSSGALGYVASVSRFTTDGFRDHSAAERKLANVKLSWKPDESSRLTVVANRLALPAAKDPLGLDRAQFEADPRGVAPAAIAFNTRKSVDQTQLGVTYERRLDRVHSVRALVYSGRRDTEQFQSIPTGPQASPTHAGGVIALDRAYHGIDLRWTAKTALNERPFTMIAGLAHDALDEHRRGYQNFIGTTLGVQGDLRRDERNDVSNLDPYLQASWQFAPRWTLDGGVRHSSVRFASADRYIVGANPDDSGRVRSSATLPVVGLMFALSDPVHLYATAGHGFETPTLNELSYRPNGATGLNLALQPARSRSREIGIKTRSGGGGTFNVALFETRTQDEIVTLTNVAGRLSFQNAGATRRRGLEVEWSKPIGANLQAHAAYTWLDARYSDAFTTCGPAPCMAPNLTIPAGNKIPGIARSVLYGALSWAPSQGLRGGVEGRVLSRVYVNDANSDAAAGHAMASAHLGYVKRVGAWELTGFGRVDNLFARRYAGSVIVGEGNGRYFEPAPGRTWLAGVSATLGF
ncbi:MAG: TonB-dependent receptor [Burkholderiaceae bacterium]